MPLSPTDRRTRAGRPRGGSTEALTIGGVAGALVTVGIWALQQFGNIDVPATLAAPLTTIVSALGTGVYISVHWLIERLDRKSQAVEDLSN